MINTPKLTVDVIIETGEGFVLIERKNYPKGYALPGGFVEIGETIEKAAVREAKEETGLDIHLTDILYVYSDPQRDPRGHTVTVVFIGKPCGGTLSASSDAKSVKIMKLEELERVQFAFDHNKIVLDYIKYKTEGVKPKPCVE